MESSNSQNLNQNIFTRFKSFEYRFDVIEYPEALKVAGVPKYHGNTQDFIGEYFVKFETHMKNINIVYKPYTIISVWSSLLGEKRENSWESGDRIWGCLVNSLNNLPEGIVGADTGLKKFLVMTVRGNSWEDCEAVSHPVDYFKELMPKEYIEVLYPPIREVNWHFQINENSCMSYIETENEINTNPEVIIYERKYYAPLKY
jgi:hypothetical protein